MRIYHYYLCVPSYLVLKIVHIKGILSVRVEVRSVSHSVQRDKTMTNGAGCWNTVLWLQACRVSVSPVWRDVALQSSSYAGCGWNHVVRSCIAMMWKCSWERKNLSIIARNLAHWNFSGFDYVCNVKWLVSLSLCDALSYFNYFTGPWWN